MTVTRMNETASYIMEIASKAASKRACSQADSLDVLLAILTHERSAAATVLAGQSIGARPMNGPPLIIEGVVIAEAERQAAMLGHSYLGAEHLLLAILDLQSDEVVFSPNVDRAAMRAELFELLARNASKNEGRPEVRAPAEVDRQRLASAYRDSESHHHP